MNQNFYVLHGYHRTKYAVFKDGTVISLGRISERGYVVKDRVLIPRENSNGYLRVSMNLSGKHKSYFVHRLVAAGFVEKTLGCNVVNHKDGNKTNNHYSNLEWVTSSDNNKHAFATGLKEPTVAKGETHGCHKLTQHDVDYIRNVHTPRDKVYGSKPLAKKFSVRPQTITDIVHFRTWR